MSSPFVRVVRDAFATLPISRRARIGLTIAASCLLAVEGVAILLNLPGSSWSSLLWVLAAAIVVAVAAWWPTWGALLTLAIAFASSAWDVTGTFQLGVAIVAAIVARTCAGSFMAAAGMAYIAWAALTPGGGLANLTAVLLTSFCALFGAVLRAAARRNRVLERQLIDHEERRRAAITAERTRIAVEMHDVVAHALTIIAMHSSVLERTDDTAQRRRSQRAIGQVSRQAVEDMRTMLSALHEGRGTPEHQDDGPDLVEPLGRLEALAEGLRTAGIRTTSRLPERLELPAPLVLAVVRIAQEATTNILKHASASETAALELVVSDRSVVVQIENTMPTSGAPAAPPSGFGLVGLQERTKLFGGALSTGRLGDTWRVRAELPLHGDPAGVVDATLV